MALESAKAKVDRAREQIDTLEDQIKWFLDYKPYAIEQVLDREANRKRAIYRVTKDMPVKWTVIVGESAYDLRSALDHSVYELTVLEQGNPLDRTEFPIFDDENKYYQVFQKGIHKGEPVRTSGLFKIRGINKKAKTVINALQPFEFRKTHPDPHDHTVISLIHELNIVDKHRQLHILKQLVGDIDWVTLRDIALPTIRLPGTELEDGTELLSWTPTIPDDEMDVALEQLKIIFIFGETIGLEGQEVIPTLRRLANNVERILMGLERTLS